MAALEKEEEEEEEEFSLFTPLADLWVSYPPAGFEIFFLVLSELCHRLPADLVLYRFFSFFFI